MDQRKYKRPWMETFDKSTRSLLIQKDIVKNGGEISFANAMFWAYLNEGSQTWLKQTNIMLLWQCIAQL